MVDSSHDELSMAGLSEDMGRSASTESASAVTVVSCTPEMRAS